MMSHAGNTKIEPLKKLLASHAGNTKYRSNDKTFYNETDLRAQLVGVVSQFRDLLPLPGHPPALFSRSVPV